ncbi:RNA polymerase subunit sigma-70 [Cryptosporangium sp. NPDC048952]|uniref:RNA polymerase subunit sigma-70 n=1 Tax=Cryptosporangium sp. NPDC048952 TaxID=3363961 RepID=UPI00371B1412
MEILDEAVLEAHRRELRAHCYRMVGALGEADDLVQETFLRAWKGRTEFEGRSSLRTWLYRIATNACLDALASGQRRVLPADVGPADPRWLEPIPDHLLDPATGSVDRETLEIAFLAAIQHLPPRQRAVLILRDVLGWPAAATGDSLGLSVPAVKSALQRARATLRERLPREREEWRRDASTDERRTLRRYVAAHRSGDRHALAALLAEDVRAEFAPSARWIEGRDAYLDEIRDNADPGVYRYVEAGANHQPAMAVYLRAPGVVVYRLHAVQVLRVSGGVVVGIVDFHAPQVLDSFSPELPSELA